MFRIEIVGIAELERNFISLVAVLDDEVRKATLRAALIVLKEAKEVGFTKGGFTRGPRGGRKPTPPPRFPRTFRRTGNTARSLRAGVTRSASGRGWIGHIGSPSKVMLFLEEGTSRMRARKLLTRSMRRKTREINAEYLKAPGAAIGKVF